MPFNLLIVDDDRDLLSVLENLFTGENYSVETSSDGAEALEKCRQNTYDIVITDIMMPGMTGLELLIEIKKICPETLVILITGFASLETAIKAIREGAYDYITKPFKLEQIKVVVRNASEKITLIKENKRLIKKLQEAYEELNLVKKIMASQELSDSLEIMEANSLAPRTRKELIVSDPLPHLLMSSYEAERNLFIKDLERVAVLKERGLITTREFELCKAKLFNSLK